MDEPTIGVLALVAAWMKEAGLTEIRATEEQAAEARDDDNVFTFYKDDGELVLKLTPRDVAEEHQSP